jgi:hypothetical protein
MSRGRFCKVGERVSERPPTSCNSGCEPLCSARGKNGSKLSKSTFSDGKSLLIIFFINRLKMRGECILIFKRCRARATRASLMSFKLNKQGITQKNIRSTPVAPANSCPAVYVYIYLVVQGFHLSLELKMNFSYIYFASQRQ